MAIQDLAASILSAAALPEPDREALIRQIRYTVGNALGVRFWQILKDQFHPSFQDFIEQHLSTAPFPATA
ncbi:MAG: hypothetical protein PVH91_15935 [Pseudomonadales bacterium]|jgi:hypothetical protein